MHISDKDIWRSLALLVSLTNTKEQLHLGIIGANRPSREGLVNSLDWAIALCYKAGSTEIRLRADTDYALTAGFDHFDTKAVKLVFG